MQPPVPHALDRGSARREGVHGPRAVIVLVGGEMAATRFVRPLPSDATVIAADSGLHLARNLGLEVDLLVGDLDSVDADVLADAESAGIRIDRHPVDKDETDLALALDAAIADGPASVTVIGGHGGRLDHLLGGALLLASPRYAQSRITAHMGPAIVTVVHDEAEIVGRADEFVSLVPVHGDAHGVTTRGLKFPLTGERLPAGSSRGVSNELLGSRAQVRIISGVLLVVQPGAPAPDAESGDRSVCIPPASP